MNFEVGDILFVRGDTWLISPLVKTVLDSEYSHVALAVGRDQIAEIDLFQRLSIKTNPYKDYEVFRYHEGLTVLKKIMIQDFIRQKKKTSKGYDWTRIIEVILRRFTNWDGVIDTDDREICFEVIDLAYKASGIDLKLSHLEDLLLSSDLIQIR